MKSNFWKDLPMWAKGTIAVVSLLAIAGVGYGIYRSVKKGVDKAKQSKEGKESKNELDDLADKGVKPTITDAEAEAKVSALLNAASDCDFWGQGATQIIAVIKSLKNQADYYLLSSKFGTKSWMDCGTGDVSGSLTTLLIDELDSGQMKDVRKHLSGIGINI